MANESIKLLKSIEKSNNKIVDILSKNFNIEKVDNSFSIKDILVKKPNTGGFTEKDNKTLSSIDSNIKSILDVLKNKKEKPSSNGDSFNLNIASIATGLSFFNNTKYADNFKYTMDIITYTAFRLKRIKDEIPLLESLGVNVGILGKSLKKSLILFKIIKPFVGIFGAVFDKMGETFTKTGKNSKKIEKGVKAYEHIGKSLMYLSGGLAVFALTLGTIIAISPPLLLAMPLVIGGLAFEYYLIGKKSKSIRKGSYAMDSIGISLMVLSGGIALFSLGLLEADKNLGAMGDPIGTSLKVMLMLGTAAAMYWFVGKGFSSIVKGSLAFASIGLSLAALGWGLKSFSKSVEGDWEQIGKMGVVLGGLGVVFAIAGAGVTTALILAGSLAFAAIGGGLYALGEGLQSYQKFDVEKFNGENFKKIISALASGFGELSILGGDVMSAQVGQQMGTALTSIAGGIGSFANLQNIKLIDSYDQDGNPIYSGKSVNIVTAIDSIKNVLGVGNSLSILTPFIDFGKNFGDSKGSLMSSIFGGDFRRTPTERGISAAADIGDVLSGVAEGVGRFANLQNIPLIKGYDKNGKPIYSGTGVDIKQALKTIRNVLGIGGEVSILTPFIDFGKNFGDSKGSLMSSIFGGDFRRTPTERGISAAVEIGDVLSGIGGGISAFADLQGVRVATEWDANGKPIKFEKANLNTSIDNLSFALRKVLKSLKGIEVEDLEVDGLGSLISGIASSIGVFATKNVRIPTAWDSNGKPIKFDAYGDSWETVSSRVTNTLGIILRGLNTIENDVDTDDINDLVDSTSKLIDGVVLPLSSTVSKFKDHSFLTFSADVGSGLGLMLLPFSQNKKASFNFDKDKLNSFTIFKKSILDLTKIQKPFDKFTKSFEVFANSMGDYAKNFNLIDKSNLAMMNEWTKSFIDFAKLDINRISKNLKDSSESFNFNLTKSVDKNLSTVTNSIKNMEVSKNNGGNQIDFSQIINELSALRSEFSQLKEMISDGIDVEVTNDIKIKDDNY